MQLLARGIARRHTGVTQTNSASSRSHCVVTATLESRLVEDGITSFRTSRLHLVDSGRWATSSCSRLSTPAEGGLSHQGLAKLISQSFLCSELAAIGTRLLTLQAVSGSWLLRQRDSS